MSESLTVKISPKGALTLSAELLERAGLKPGETVHIRLETGGLRLVSLASSVRALRGRFATGTADKRTPGGTSEDARITPSNAGEGHGA